MAGSKNLNLNGIKQGFVFDSSARPGSFIYQAYGAQSFEVRVNGRASHSGIAPERGVHAIKIAADALHELPVGRIDENTTMNFGTIRGGSAVNVVPDLVIIDGEIRSSVADRVPQLGNLIEHTFRQKAEAGGGSSVYSAHWDFMPYRIDPASTVFQRISGAIERAGLKPNPVISKGGSDANSFNENGIPTVNIGIGAQNPHANDEFIYLDDLAHSAAIAWELIRSDV
jgi:tripeptide aminopeptidase